MPPTLCTKHLAEMRADDLTPIQLDVHILDALRRNRDVQEKLCVALQWMAHDSWARAYDTDGYHMGCVPAFGNPFLDLLDACVFAERDCGPLATMFLLEQVHPEVMAHVLMMSGTKAADAYRLMHTDLAYMRGCTVDLKALWRVFDSAGTTTPHTQETVRVHLHVCERYDHHVQVHLAVSGHAMGSPEYCVAMHDKSLCVLARVVMSDMRYSSMHPPHRFCKEAIEFHVYHHATTCSPDNMAATYALEAILGFLDPVDARSVFEDTVQQVGGWYVNDSKHRTLAMAAELLKRPGVCRDFLVCVATRGMRKCCHEHLSGLGDEDARNVMALVFGSIGKDSISKPPSVGSDYLKKFAKWNRS